MLRPRPYSFSYVVLNRLINHLEGALAARPRVDDDTRDEDLFLPFARAYIIGTITFEYTSLYREIGRMLAEIVAEYEEEHSVTVDKTQLLVARSVLCLQQNDEEGFLLYFELAQTESQRKSGQALSIDTMVSELSKSLDPVINDIQKSFDDLPQVATGHGRIDKSISFPSIVHALSGANLGNCITCGLRLRRVLYWLQKHSALQSTQLWAKELLSSLCVLFESIMKEQLCASEKDTLAKLLQHNRLSVAIKAVLGKPKPKTGYFDKYASSGQADFSANLPILVNDLKSKANATHVTAMCYYGSYMIRNQVLHAHDFTSALFRRKGLLLDGIGLLCSAIWFAAQRREMK